MLENIAMIKKLIDSDNEKKNYKSIDVDDMYIKAGINWDVN